ARLGEMAQRLGIRLPVYVLFTKADTIPHFDAFVQRLTPDEAKQPLGAGLAADAGPAGTYAERATAAITAAYEELYTSLAAWRLPVLHRETVPDRKPGAYEFPREVRKLQPVVVEFLRELCKPSQLEVSPLLRGFYFTGVQAVFVTDSAAAASQQPAVATASAASATGVFSAAQARAASAPSYTPPSTRKIARWDFLDGIFRDVVLADSPALQATQGGTRLNLVRRSLLGAAAALALLAAIGFTVSYRNNRALEREVAAAARALAGTPAAGAELPAVDALRRLDGVRAMLDRLSGYERDGAPLGHRWGLYVGGRLHEPVRQLYFDAFDKLVFGATRASLVGSLRGFPDVQSPGAEYGPAYDQLKAHLITTSHPQHAAMDFLPEALMRAWTTGRTVDEERRGLARRQFETYTRELAARNPYAFAADAEAVRHAREYLRSFQGVEPIYRGLLAEAARKSAPIRFAQLRPEAARLVHAPHEVPAAFTKDGWTFMQARLKSPDALTKGEEWVVGNQGVVPAADRQRTIQQIRTMYETEYADQWRTFLRTASVAPFGLGGAPATLGTLAGNQSPILELLNLVALHTGQGTELPKIFQPARGLVPGSPSGSLVKPTNQPYLQALSGLREAVVAVVGAPPGPARAPAAENAKARVEQVKSTVDEIARGFTPDPSGVVHQQVDRILRQPALALGGSVGNVPAEDANRAGAQLCAAIGGVNGKFPFNPNATASASAQEVADVLRPGSGRFWSVYNQSLTSIAVREGRIFRQADAPYRVSPQFLQLLSKYAMLSELLFPSGSQQPRLNFQVVLQGAPSELASVAIAVGGDSYRTTQNNLTLNLALPNATGGAARLAVTQGSTESAVASAPAGPWSILRLFHQAARVQPLGGDAQRFDWNVPNVMRDGAPVRVSAELRAGQASALFMREEMAAVGCPGRIAY
ncbi:MAG TPA: ImcF-related family protein, partial [Gemmatimonadaceae bacterium]|nr:ImcF-related family protein [Gemmatimonadaceae bacterium]